MYRVYVEHATPSLSTPACRFFFCGSKPEIHPRWSSFAIASQSPWCVRMDDRILHTVILFTRILRTNNIAVDANNTHTWYSYIFEISIPLSAAMISGIPKRGRSYFHLDESSLFISVPLDVGILFIELLNRAVMIGPCCRRCVVLG